MRMWLATDCVFLYENAPAHWSLVIQYQLTKHCIVVFPYPPYSPIITLCDIYLFLQMKDYN